MHLVSEEKQPGVRGHLRDKVLLLPALVNEVPGCPRSPSPAHSHTSLRLGLDPASSGKSRWGTWLHALCGHCSFTALGVVVTTGHAYAHWRLSEFYLEPAGDCWHLEDRGWVSLHYCLLPETGAVPGHSGRSIHPAGRKEQRKEGHRRAIRTSRANGASC